jgi:periplasmic copper chaperone A
MTPVTSIAARTAAALLLGLALLVALALPASAHVELEPGQAEAGSTTTVTFSFRHGKDGTATTGLSVQVPDGAAIVEVPAKEGWTSAVTDEGTVVTWTGGSVPDGTQAAFPVVVRLPAREGEVLFPTIQTTGAGELAWISADEGESEDDHPAPRLVLTPSQAPSSTAGEPSTTTRAPRDLPRTILEAEQRDDGDGSLGPWLIASGVVAVLAIGIGGTILSRRSRS